MTPCSTKCQDSTGDPPGYSRGTHAQACGEFGSAGRFSIQVDTGAIPMGPPVAIQPGETWKFQAWYRDENPRSTTNLSAALAVTFR